MNDVVFRSSVAGFNKEDVLNYIEDIKKQYEEQKNKLTENACELSNAFKKINELETQLLEYKNIADELSLENSQYISMINNKPEQSPVCNLSDNEMVSDCSDKLKILSEENEMLKFKSQELNSECEKYKANEKQFESIIMDAYINSESILDDARQKAEQISKGTQCSIEQASENFADFSLYISNISAGFSEIVFKLTEDIKHLTNNLMSVTKELQDNDAEETSDTYDGDINMYINNHEEQVNDFNCTDSSKYTAEESKDMSSYIKKFESMISGNANANADEVQTDNSINETSSNDVAVQSQEQNNEIECENDYSTYQNDDTNLAETDVNELIGEYTSDSDTVLQEPTQEVASEIPMDESLTEEAKDEANFISSAPIGNFRMDIPLEQPLNSSLIFDENFNLKSNNEPAQLDDALGSQPLSPDDNQESFPPLQTGMDYSELFQFDDSGNENNFLKHNTDQQFSDIVNEYANSDTSELINNQIADKNASVSEIGVATVTSKKVNYEIEEPMMVDPKGLYKAVDDHSGKTRFGKVKIKMSKNK
ncbi:MAG: hypothetical protein RSC30_00675 [Oscillospiraceae bacterium]